MASDSFFFAERQQKCSEPDKLPNPKTGGQRITDCHAGLRAGSQWQGVKGAVCDWAQRCGHRPLRSAAGTGRRDTRVPSATAAPQNFPLSAFRF